MRRAYVARNASALRPARRAGRLGGQLSCCFACPAIVAAAIAGEGAPQEDIDLIRQTYGLRPAAAGAILATGCGRLVRGDFGDLALLQDRRPRPLILGKLPTTLLLGILSLAFALVDLDPARRPRRRLHATAGSTGCALAIAVVGQALPNFFFALLLIMLFSIHAALAAGLRQRHLGCISSCRRSRSAITSRPPSCGSCAPA